MSPTCFRNRGPAALRRRLASVAARVRKGNHVANAKDAAHAAAGRRGQGQQASSRGCRGRGDRPPNAPTARSKSRRGICPREKVFGPDRLVPVDRNAKVRVMMVARALMRHQEKGKAYGKISAKALAVLSALLWRFHNAATAKCSPSYEAIAEAAGCGRSTGVRGDPRP